MLDVLRYLEKQDCTNRQVALRLIKDNEYTENIVLNTIKYMVSVSYVSYVNKYKGCGFAKLRITPTGKEKLRTIRKK